MSDATDFSVGVRKITYTVPGTDNLTVSVNGVRGHVQGRRLGPGRSVEAHSARAAGGADPPASAGQLYDHSQLGGAKYERGFLRVVRPIRHHALGRVFSAEPARWPESHGLWRPIWPMRATRSSGFEIIPRLRSGARRNEGFPPKEIDDGLKKLMAELEPTRLYQPSSTSGHGVHSGGLTTGGIASDSISSSRTARPSKRRSAASRFPTLESVHAMMPRKDWESIDDDWAEHDLTRGAQAWRSVSRRS